MLESLSMLPIKKIEILVQQSRQKKQMSPLLCIHYRFQNRY